MELWLPGTKPFRKVFLVRRNNLRTTGGVGNTGIVPTIQEERWLNFVMAMEEDRGHLNTGVGIAAVLVSLTPLL